MSHRHPVRRAGRPRGVDDVRQLSAGGEPGRRHRRHSPPRPRRPAGHPGLPLRPRPARRPARRGSPPARLRWRPAWRPAGPPGKPDPAAGKPRPPSRPPRSRRSSPGPGPGTRPLPTPARLRPAARTRPAGSPARPAPRTLTLGARRTATASGVRAARTANNSATVMSSSNSPAMALAARIGGGVVPPLPPPEFVRLHRGTCTVCTGAARVSGDRRQDPGEPVREAPGGTRVEQVGRRLQLHAQPTGRPARHGPRPGSGPGRTGLPRSRPRYGCPHAGQAAGRVHGGDVLQVSITWNSGYRPGTGPAPGPRPAARTARPGGRARPARSAAPGPAAAGNVGVARQVGAQHQRVDEEADQVIEGRVGPARDSWCRSGCRCPRRAGTAAPPGRPARP